MTPSVDEPGIDYYYYTRMLRAAQRVMAFKAGLASTIRSGEVVVEIGAGLGTYSLFAAQCGARRVYAIEKGPVITLARELAARNGYSEQITFLHGHSTEVILPEQADMLILEDFSSLFVRRGLEEMVRDAVSRHLKPGATVIPHAVSLYLAPLGDAALWTSILELEDHDYRLYGLDLGLLREIMLGSPHVRAIDEQALLSAPVKFKTIELARDETYLFDEVLSVKIARAGAIYGLVGWFDAAITGEILLSNAPSNTESLWRQVFFPFPAPLDVAAGETAVMRICCSRSRDTRDIWWTWQAAAASGVAASSSFQGTPLRAGN
jgi:hypothetical protein